MRRQAIGLAFLVLVMALPTVMARPDAPEDEKLYGTWLVTTIEVTGGKIPTPEEPMIVFSKGGKAVLKEKNKPDMTATWKVSVVKNIKEIDLGKQEGDLKAIYEINGDTLKMAISPLGAKGERPTVIDSKVAVVMTLKRQKP